MKERVFNINSTNACKGMALILLLWHHLFYMDAEFGFFSYNFALLSKVCVAIFIILSGYGFSESIKLKNFDLIIFYKKRLASIYLNYWFIAAIFVPLGIIFFNRSLDMVFTSNPIIKFLIQMTGLHRYAYSEYGYNATWWYLSVIIPLIIIFPFLYGIIKKYGLLVLLCIFALLFVPNSQLTSFIKWLLPFALGIYLSEKKYISAISIELNRFGAWRFLFLFFLITLVAFLRNHNPFLTGTKIDWLFGSFIILFTFELTVLSSAIQSVLGFLGKHLFNIFLFHSFIYSYYWKKLIYSFESPLAIFGVLLLVCILISMLIEKIKRHIYFYEAIGKISEFSFLQATKRRSFP